MRTARPEGTTDRATDKEVELPESLSEPGCENSLIGRTIWARRGGAFQRCFGIAHTVRCRACKSWKPTD